VEGFHGPGAARIDEAVLDEILAIQLTVAWAGEARTEPPRLGWWQTALNDDLGGRDLLRRLAPRTHAWATLEATRQAARKVDAALRAEAADADLLVSLFRLGFSVDEQLDDRLATHKRHEVAPCDALSLPFDLAAPFDRKAFTVWLEGLAQPSAPEATAVGRRLRGAPAADALEVVRHLAASLVPLVDSFPAPHYRLGR